MSLLTPASRLCLLGVLLGAPMAHAETLEQAFDAALQADHRLAASRRQSDAARAGVDAAHGLALPQLVVDAAYARLSEAPAYRVDIPPLPATSLPVAEDKTLAYRAGITVPVYTGGRITAAGRAAEAALDAAEDEQRRTVQDTRMAAAEAYVAVLRARRGLALAESGVAALEAHAADAAGFYERGLVARSDLLAARSAAANAVQDRLRAKTALTLAGQAYNRLLGRAPEAVPELDDLPPGRANPDDPGGDGAARAELSALGHQSAALRQQAEAERAADRPQLALDAGYDHVRNRYLLREGFWTVGLGLHWTVFDGMVGRKRAAALEARADALDETRADIASRIGLQVRAARLEVEESRARIAVAATAVEQSEENLKVARDRYRSGVGSSTEVLDAEALRIKSLGNRDNAIYDNVIAALRLRHARGEL